MRADVHALVGPYALDALRSEERVDFEEHLGACSSCRAEIRELREVVARLGRAAAEPPPPHLRAVVLAAAADLPQDRPVVALRSARRRAGLAVAGVAAAALTALGVGWQLQDADQRAERAEEMAAVVMAPDAGTVELQGAAMTAKVVHSPAHGAAVLVADGMPPAPEGHGYELWLEVDGQMRPAGMLSPGERGEVRHLMEGPMDGVTAIGVTIEPEGGSPEPTGDLVLHGQVGAPA